MYPASPAQSIPLILRMHQCSKKKSIILGKIGMSLEIIKVVLFWPRINVSRKYAL